MTLRWTRAGGRLAAAATAVAVLGGCVPEVRRGPVELTEAGVVDETSIWVSVPSCNGDPIVSRLIETAQEIQLEVVTTVHRNGDDCLDGITVRLGAPIGERQVVDLTSGRELPLSRDR